MHADIDDYLASLAPASAEAVSEIRRRVHEAVPDAQETISYDMPTFTRDGRAFVTGTHVHPNTNGGRTHRGHVFGHHPQTARQDGAFRRGRSILTGAPAMA